MCVCVCVFPHVLCFSNKCLFSHLLFSLLIRIFSIRQTRTKDLDSICCPSGLVVRIPDFQPGNHYLILSQGTKISLLSAALCTLPLIDACIWIQEETNEQVKKNPILTLSIRLLLVLLDFFPFSQLLFNNLILSNKLKYNLTRYIRYIYGETSFLIHSINNRASTKCHHF